MVYTLDIFSCITVYWCLGLGGVVCDDCIEKQMVHYSFVRYCTFLFSCEFTVYGYVRAKLWPLALMDIKSRQCCAVPHSFRMACMIKRNKGDNDLK
jgi:hypothetical protein